MPLQQNKALQNNTVGMLKCWYPPPHKLHAARFRVIYHKKHASFVRFHSQHFVLPQPAPPTPVDTLVSYYIFSNIYTFCYHCCNLLLSRTICFKTITSIPIYYIARPCINRCHMYQRISCADCPCALCVCYWKYTSLTHWTTNSLMHIFCYLLLVIKPLRFRF